MGAGDGGVSGGHSGSSPGSSGGGGGGGGGGSGGSCGSGGSGGSVGSGGGGGVWPPPRGRDQGSRWGSRGLGGGGVASVRQVSSPSSASCPGSGATPPASGTMATGPKPPSVVGEVGDAPEAGGPGGAGQAEADVHVVGVRAGPLLGRPPGIGGPRAPDAVVVDDVHDAEAAGHGVLVAVLVGGQQPGEHLAGGLALGGIGDVGPQSQARPSLCSSRRRQTPGRWRSRGRRGRPRGPARRTPRVPASGWGRRRSGVDTWREVRSRGPTARSSWPPRRARVIVDLAGPDGRGGGGWRDARPLGAARGRLGSGVGGARPSVGALDAMALVRGGAITETLTVLWCNPVVAQRPRIGCCQVAASGCRSRRRYSRRAMAS